MTDTQPIPETTAAPAAQRPRLRWLFWTALLVLLVMVQWPMLKGAFYRATGMPPPADNIPWRTDYEAALSESRQTGKPVLIDFTADWCPPCQVMKHDVWPDDSVRQAIEAGTIPLLIDIDDPATQGLQVRYQVSSIPTILLVDGDGRVLKTGAFMSRRGMLDFLPAS